MLGLPQGGKWHRFPPPPRRSQVLWPTTAVRFFSGRASPPREQRGGRLQVQSRHCAGAGGWRSPRCLGKSFPKSRLSPRGARRPPPLASRTPLLWRGLERTLGAPPRLHGLGFGKGWRAAEAFPRVCSKSGSGKVFQSSQQRLPRSPLRGEETAASAPVSSPPAQSSGLARWEPPGFPAGRPSSPGRKPQLTQAAPKAEAARPNCSSRTAAPTPGACTEAQAAHRGGGPAEAL